MKPPGANRYEPLRCQVSLLLRQDVCRDPPKSRLSPNVSVESGTQLYLPTRSTRDSVQPPSCSGQIRLLSTLYTPLYILHTTYTIYLYIYIYPDTLDLA